MRRYLYSNLVRVVVDFILLLVSLPSLIISIYSLLQFKLLNIISITILSMCCIIMFALHLLLFFSDKYSSKYIYFCENYIEFNKNKYDKVLIRFRYFLFKISIVNEILVIPKLIISLNGLNVICYLSKKDIKKLINWGYDIDVV